MYKTSALTDLYILDPTGHCTCDIEEDPHCQNF